MSLPRFAENDSMNFAVSKEQLTPIAPVVVERLAPVWADYVWLARGESSRLYPVVRDFLHRIESAAACVTSARTEAFRRRGALKKYRLKSLVYSLLGSREQREKYAGRIANEQRALRDAAITVGAGELTRGPLSEIMDRCGSDKASGRHNYALLYDLLFRDERKRFARVFELGIGTNNQDVAFNMGASGVPGASLRGWREYFPNAIIFGGDIDERILFKDDRITTAAVDQTNPESIERLFSAVGDGFDLIIDDGCHTVHANLTFFEGAYARLKPGGLHVIEDVNSRHRDAYKAVLGRHDAVLIDIPHERNHDDNCLAIVLRDGDH